MSLYISNQNFWCVSSFTTTSHSHFDEIFCETRAETSINSNNVFSWTAIWTFDLESPSWWMCEQLYNTTGTWWPKVGFFLLWKIWQNSFYQIFKVGEWCFCHVATISETSRWINSFTKMSSWLASLRTMVWKHWSKGPNQDYVIMTESISKSLHCVCSGVGWV